MLVLGLFYETPLGYFVWEDGFTKHPQDVFNFERGGFMKCFRWMFCFREGDFTKYLQSCFVLRDGFMNAVISGTRVLLTVNTSFKMKTPQGIILQLKPSHGMVLHLKPFLGRILHLKILPWCVSKINAPQSGFKNETLQKWLQN